MSLEQAIRWILPKEHGFFELMERQATTAHRAAQALAKLAEDGTKPAEVRASVQAIEHEGDALVHEIEEALARTFVTPIDREDIQRLSTYLDDICDVINHTGRSFALYGAEKASPSMALLLGDLVTCTGLIAQHLPALRKGEYADLREASRSVKATEKHADDVFRDAVSQLFRDTSIDAKALVRDKELLEGLEKAIDACEDAAEFIMNMAIKHG